MLKKLNYLAIWVLLFIINSILGALALVFASLIKVSDSASRLGGVHEKSHQDNAAPPGNHQTPVGRQAADHATVVCLSSGIQDECMIAAAAA